MLLRVSPGRAIGLALLAFLTLLAAPARAINIPPGGSVGLPGTIPPGGVVAADILIPFDIVSGGGALLYRGVLQNRVVREASGQYAFYYRIRDTVAGLNGIIRNVRTIDFSGWSCDVDWDTSSPGNKNPTRAQRSAGVGNELLYIFGNNLFSNETSRFFYSRTNALAFARTGLTTIELTTGETVTLSTFEPVRDNTPPIGTITGPGPFSCVCDFVTITGTANDPESFSGYTLEWANSPAGPWNLITSSGVPVVNGVLGVWNASALPQGYYWIRLVVTNGVGQTTTFTTVLFLDQQFDSLDVREPDSGDVIGGLACFDGTVWDTCFDSYTVEWRTSGGIFFTPVDPANPVYFVPVINDPFATWNTTLLADGDYVVRVAGRDTCGNTATVTRRVVIDNTAPTTIIQSPQNCDSVGGLVSIKGTVFDVHLAGWILEVTGGPYNSWVTIASGNANILDSTIAIWDTTDLPPCCYTIRLRATDTSNVSCSTSNYNETLVSVDVGCPADFNGDGFVDFFDFDDFVAAFEAGCP